MSNPRSLLRRGASRAGERVRAEVGRGVDDLSRRLMSLGVRAGNAGRTRTVTAISLAVLQTSHGAGSAKRREHARLNLELGYWQLGRDLVGKDRYDRAISLLERSLALNQGNAIEQLSPRVDAAELLDLLGRLCYATGQSARAARYFAHLAEVRQAQGEAAEELLARRQMLHALARLAGTEREPRLFFQLADHAAQVVEIAADRGDEEARAAALREQCFALVEGGARGEPVVKLLEEALRTWEGQGDGDHADHVRTEIRLWLGDVFDDRDEPALALPLLRTAREYEGPLSAEFCRRQALRCLGNSLESLGDFVAAERYLREGIRYCEAKNSPFVFEFRSRLAVNLASQGEPNVAIELAEEALAQAESLHAQAPDIQSHESLLATLSHLVKLYNDHGRDYRRAAALCRREIEVAAGEPHAQLDPGLLYNLAITLKNGGDRVGLEESIPVFERCLAACRQTAAVRIEGTACCSLGEAYLRLGQHEQGANAFRTAVAVFRKSGNGADTTEALKALAAVPGLSPGEVAKCLSQVAEIGAWTGDPGMQAFALRELARTRIAVGLPDEAVEHQRRGIEIVESARARLGSSVDRAGLMRTHAGLYADAAVHAHARHEGRRAFQCAEAGRARLTLDRRAEEADGLIADPELRRRRRALAAEIAEATRALEQVGGHWLLEDDAQADALPTLEAERKQVEGELRRLEGEWRQLESAVAEGNPRFAARAAAGIEAVWPVPRIQQELIGDDGVLLEYLVSDEGCLLFAITKREFEVVKLSISPRALQMQVDELCKALEEVDPGYPHGHALYEALLKPAESLIEGKEEVLICPHGPLHRLPFAVLLREDPGADGADGAPYFGNRWGELPYFLRDGMQIRYIASATTEGMLRVAEEMEAPAYREQLLALAAPLASSNGSFGKDLPPLRFALEELTAAASQFGPEKVKALPASPSDPAATKEAALQLLEDDRGYRFVHFATHALLDDRAPWFSALLFEPAGDDPTMPGYLHANEAIDLELPAECVTMSGCRTLGAEDGAGEGMVGLALAFRHAGARSVCGSLWQVADGSTACLMEHFYSRLGDDGHSPAAALAHAQRQLIAEAYHPRHWAAFGLYG